MSDGDPRIVLTVDAGGTKFGFKALRAGRVVALALNRPSGGHDLNACLEGLRSGLESLLERAGGKADAICCGFPGPADYAAGIVGPQKNLPCILEPLALGPTLREWFGIPSFLRNDADLFVYGEALGGFLPSLNASLREAGAKRTCSSLFGITLGTGLGAGFISEGRMVAGDHGGGVEIWCLPSGANPKEPAEEHASARAVVRSYAELAEEEPGSVPEPEVLADIARGRATGNAEAAREAFRRLGAAAGHAAAQAVALLDCPLVLGGGLSGAAELFLPALVEAMNAPLRAADGREVSRLDGRAFPFESLSEREAYLTAECRQPASRLFPVGVSRLGTGHAAALGAYAAAIEALDRQDRPARGAS